MNLDRQINSLRNLCESEDLPYLPLWLKDKVEEALNDAFDIGHENCVKKMAEIKGISYDKAYKLPANLYSNALKEVLRDYTEGKGKIYRRASRLWQAAGSPDKTPDKTGKLSVAKKDFIDFLEELPKRAEAEMAYGGARRINLEYGR